MPFRIVLVKKPKHIWINSKAKPQKRGRKTEKPIDERQYESLKTKWNFLITNLSAKQLPAENARDLYSVSWQIELLFKCLKSECGLKNVKKYSTPAAVESFILAKLIYCVVSLGVFKILSSEETYGVSSMSWFRGVRYNRYRIIDLLLKKKLNELAQFFERIYLFRTKRKSRASKLSLEQVWESFAPVTPFGAKLWP